MGGPLAADTAALGLIPDQNYEVVFSKGHERSVVGVMHGFYDGAAVASLVKAKLA